MRGMRLRIAILLSLLVVGALIAAVQPAQAEIWTGELTIACQAKKVDGTLGGLTYATLGPSQTQSYTILCGKPVGAAGNGHVKHVMGGPNIPGLPVAQMCVATIQQATPKKPTPKAPELRPLPGGPTPLFANCLLLMLVTIEGWCGFSIGEFFGLVHIKTAYLDGNLGDGTWELKYFAGTWGTPFPPFNGIKLFAGTADKGGLPTAADDPMFGVASVEPDLIRKLDSCLGPTKAEGAGAFQVVGTAMIFGINVK